MSVRGSLGTMSVEDILEWLDRRQIAATLTLERSSVVREFVFDSGHIISTSCSEPNEHIGQVLVRAGLIDEQIHSWALEAQNESGVGFIQLVSSTGTVDESQLRALLEDLAREAICRAMTWTEGSFVVEPTEERAVAVEFPIATALQPCIEAGRQRLALRARHGRHAEGSTAPTGARRGHAPGSDPAAAPAYTADSLASAAREQLAAGNRADAFESIRCALEQEPTNPAIQQLFRDIERALFAQLSRELLSAFRVPQLLVERADLEQLELSETERYLANRIDGRWDLLSLMKASPLREVEALITFKRLADRGIIAL